MKYLIYFCFFFLAFTSVAQWKESSVAEYITVLQKSENAIPKGTSVSYNCTYKFFDTFVSETPSSESTGSFESVKGKTFFVNQMGMLMLQSDSVCLVIDTNTKMIFLRDLDTLLLKGNKSEELLNMLKESAIKVEKSSAGKLLKFSFQFIKGARFAGAEVWFDENNLLKKYVVYSATEIPMEDESEASQKMVMPKMEVTFENYQLNRKTTSTTFQQPTDFIHRVGGKYILKDPSIGFELIDLRNKK